MPLISIIIPVYNCEKTIRETIESVLNQTFSDLEIILINDGSQDTTLNIISSIEDPRLKVFNYTNSGVAVSRNRGIAQASGEFIAFLDADDFWTLDKLEAQLKALQANPQAAVAYSWVDYIDESNQFVRSGNHITMTGDVYEKLLIHNVLENGSNPLIRKYAFSEVGDFDQELSPAEDWDMWIRLAARYHFVAVPSPQVLYRISPNSLSTNVLKMEVASLRCIEKAFHQAPASLQHLKKSSLAFLYSNLTFYALGSISRQKGMNSIRFFWYAIRYGPSRFWSWQMTMKAIFKIAAVIILSPQQYRAFIKTVKNALTYTPTTARIVPK
ncbi:glycosyl transferase family A [Nostocales cyanobacterium HT-58-2]|nr:glycosyl transferase family A [Nostocales cyanobacterium HT-58-2]